LKDIGLGEIFDASAADFTCLSRALKGVPFNKAKHKAVIEVNEVGTEAAAATSLVSYKIREDVIEDYRVDRPFIYAVVNSKPKAVLFMGVIRNPLLER
jgi:serpin B